MKPAKKRRLDELLVARSLADSRSQAKAIILAGKVRSQTGYLDKPGHMIAEDIDLIVDQPPRFVSRGGEKLEGFLNQFDIDVTGSRVLDVGASSGGFTDCILQCGAIGVTCVDVGRAQLHHKLIQDPRVINIEKTNARHLQPGDLPFLDYPLIVMDLSFISLTKVLPPIWQFCAPGGRLISLVKPQFEAKKAEVDAGKGIIRDSAVHQRVLEYITHFALSSLPGSRLIGTMESPIRGTSGNKEFLLGLLRET